MMPEGSGELEQLRRRAYGPGADIWDDTGALERLLHLEGAPAEASTERPSARTEEQIGTTTTMRKYRQMVIGFVAVTAALCLGIALGIQLKTDRPTMVLDVETALEPPPWMGAPDQTDIRGFETFGSFQLWSWTETSEARLAYCVYIVSISAEDAMGGTGECVNAGGPAPSISLTVRPSTELSQRPSTDLSFGGVESASVDELEVGTTLRFTPDAHGINVWITKPQPVETSR